MWVESNHAANKKQEKCASNVQPKVTLIVLSYNNERYLMQCLSSIERQTFRDFEIIITDDGSKDGSRSIISSFVKSSKIDCTAIFQAENTGIVKSYNRALGLVRSDIIAHIASDDENHPSRLEVQYKLLSDSSSSMCISAIDVIDSFGRFIRTACPKPERQTLKAALESGNVQVTSPTMMYRRDLIDYFGTLPLDLANEDEALAFRAICRGGIEVVTEPLVRYRIHPGSIQNDMRNASLSDYAAWLTSNIPFQISNKKHWKHVLEATNRATFGERVDKIIKELQILEISSRKISFGITGLFNELILRRKHTFMIIFNFAKQKMKNARNSFWLATRITIDFLGTLRG